MSFQPMNECHHFNGDLPKLQEEVIQYLVVSGDGGVGSILGGTKHSRVEVPGPWYNSAYWCCTTL